MSADRLERGDRSRNLSSVTVWFPRLFGNSVSVSTPWVPHVRGEFESAAPSAAGVQEHLTLPVVPVAQVNYE